MNDLQAVALFTILVVCGLVMAVVGTGAEAED